MTAAAKPWMKFYPQDWRSDEKLRMCSLAARGLWMEMLAIMHRSEKYGQLLISGKSPTDPQLAVQVGAMPNEVSGLLRELAEAEVFSRTSAGVVYSRRMCRDAKRAENALKNGKKGGNPKLRNIKGNSGSDNQQDNAPDKGGVKAQRPEARDQSNKLPALGQGVAPAREPRPANGMPAQAFPDADIVSAAGFAWPLTSDDRRQLQTWLDAGIDRASTIIPILTRISERQRQAGDPPKKLRYFDQAVREDHAEDQRTLEYLENVRNRPLASGGGLPS